MKKNLYDESEEGYEEDIVNFGTSTIGVCEREAIE